MTNSFLILFTGSALYSFVINGCRVVIDARDYQIFFAPLAYIPKTRAIPKTIPYSPFVHIFAILNHTQCIYQSKTIKKIIDGCYMWCVECRAFDIDT